MKRFILLMLCLYIACCVLLSGCTEADTKGGTPPPATPRVTTSIPIASDSITPHDIQTMPPNLEVSVDIHRDQILPTITLSFNGGKGQFLVRDILVKVTRSDGVVNTTHLGLTAGDEVTIQGTRGKDRVEVTVFLKDGNQYKIVDKIVDYYSHA